MGKYTKTVKKYSGNATSQEDPNIKERHKWTGGLYVSKAVGHVSNTYGSSWFDKRRTATHYVEKKSYDKNGKETKVKVADKWKEHFAVPYTLAFHTFKLNIPDKTHIVSITFEAKMRVDKSVTVLCPVADFRIPSVLEKERYDNTDVKGKATGWNSGHYLVVPDKEKLSSSWKTFSWTMNHDDIQKAGITYENLNKDITGVDLVWQEPTDVKGNYTDKSDIIKGRVDVMWVSCTVEYDIPSYRIDIKHPLETNDYENINVNSSALNKLVKEVKGTKTSPLLVVPNDWFDLKVVCRNDSYARGGGHRYIVLDAPWDTKIRGYPKVGEFYQDMITGRYIWKVPVGANVVYELPLRVLTPLTSISELRASLYGYEHFDVDPLQVAKYYYWGGDTPMAKKGTQIGDDDIQILTPNSLSSYDLSCVEFIIHGSTESNLVRVDVDFDCPIELPMGRTEFFKLGSVVSSGTVTMDSQDENGFYLDVPMDTEFVASVTCCFYPLATNSINVTAQTSITDKVYTNRFILYSRDYYLDNLGTNTNISWYTHRVISEVESDMVMIPIMADEIDANMIMSDCLIHMNVWEDLDYIGCIPLEHHHFDPKSTYKDTLLNSTYKNKRYMGKKLATDEDITLNVRLHPQQVTTLQGLIDMDKPIPINANHKCFESDALNHRGWAEVYAVKTEETNPHWYKCDIDVKYLTHNLKTRFNIQREKNINDYEIPSVYTEVFSSGENLSDTDEDKFFDVDTDGTFMYNEDYYDEDTEEYTVIDDTERNFFSLDNGESIHIKTRNKLSNNCNIKFEWSALLLEEYRENNVSKLIKIVDGEGNSVFEYEYDSLEFITSNNELEEIQSKIIYRVGNESYFRDMVYRLTNDDIYDDLDVEDVEDGEETGLARFGSTLHFEIKNGAITVTDEGFNGRQVYIENVKLRDTDYYYVVEWKNNNADGESDPVNVKVDFVVQDTVLSTNYAERFGKLIVSPFPVPRRKLLFTREAEEGTIYYYQFEENKEFSYIVEPYYQYMNGTDLKGNVYGIGDDISIFNLNYGYDIVYIQNGLVRLGFNRMDEMGHMYLGKYDPQSESYITTHRFHLGKYVDLNLNAISDDQIEIQASDSIFTIYRGHPYIKINHNDEDIYIDTVFDRIWGEKVNGQTTDSPAYWNLYNSANLLPNSIGGKKGINDSEITLVEEEINPNKDIYLTWVSLPPENIMPVTDTIWTDTDLSFGFVGEDITNYSDEVFWDGSECSFGSYTFEEVSDNVPKYLDLVAGRDIIQVNDTVRLDAKVTDWSHKGVADTTVYFYEKYEPTLNLSADKSIMQTGETLDLKAKLKDEDGSLVKDETVYFFVKED